MAGGTDIVRIAVAGGERRVLGVVKRRIQPVGCAVTVLAGGGKELRLRGVSGVGGVVVIRLVAADADGGQGRVIVIHVAVRAMARRSHVRPGQGKGRVVVVEGAIRPSGGVVTQFACSREAGSDVIGICRPGVVLLVTGVAERAVQSVVVVDVAIRTQARRHGMLTSQRGCSGGVIEGGVGPLQGVVAGFAGGGEPGRDVVQGRLRVVVVMLMARHAGGAG